MVFALLESKNQNKSRAAAETIHMRIFYNPVIHLCLGLVGFLIGMFLVLDAPASLKQADEVARRPSLTAAQLGDAVPGREVVLEGQISPDSPLVYRSFVAYVYEEYRSGIIDETTRWHEVRRETPPLAVRLPDGDVQIVNDDYTFEQASDTFREAEPGATRGAVQSRGFTRGAQVLVIGTTEAGEKPSIHATTIWPGNRNAYVAQLRGLAPNELKIGGAITLFGLVELVVGGVQLRRFLREVREPEAVPQQPRQRGRAA